MKKVFLLLIFSCLVSMVACSNNDDIESVKVITTPEEIVGAPDRIYVVEDEEESVYERDTLEYEEILKSIIMRFPNELKEAAMAISWKNDDGTYNWGKMAEEFDYVRLSYNDMQTVELDCFVSTNHSPQKLSFNDLIFPCAEEIFIVGTDKTYGVLGKWE